jgi:hypothetical protein
VVRGRKSAWPAGDRVEGGLGWGEREGSPDSCQGGFPWAVPSVSLALGPSNRGQLAQVT